MNDSDVLQLVRALGAALVQRDEAIDVNGSPGGHALESVRLERARLEAAARTKYLDSLRTT